MDGDTVKFDWFMLDDALPPVAVQVFGFFSVELELGPKKNEQEPIIKIITKMLVIVVKVLFCIVIISSIIEKTD
ncbi:MAG TPA: hypothetical protein VKM55_16750 [Candidatus Lokiarchaeia archaeon]|nr:hypothetical protein [Candidatus Lokiarchaeia archaeon]